MKTASAALVSLLNSQNVYLMADLVTLTLYGGQVLRLTSWDSDLVLGGATFSAAGGTVWNFVNFFSPPTMKALGASAPTKGVAKARTLGRS